MITAKLLLDEGPVPADADRVVGLLHGLVPRSRADTSYPHRPDVLIAIATEPSMTAAVWAAVREPLKKAKVGITKLEKAIDKVRNAAIVARDPRVPLALNDDEIDVGMDKMRRILRQTGGYYCRADMFGKVGADPQAPDRRKFQQVTPIALTEEIASHAIVVHQGRPARLPEWGARMYLDQPTEWGVPALKGITSAPLLRPDGSIVEREGYDVASGIYVYGVPELTVPPAPSEAHAAAALARLRDRLKTFAYADRPESGQHDGDIIDILDTSQPPTLDETGALSLMLTAVLRPSISFAPMFAIAAPDGSGSRVGKGRIMHVASVIAHNTRTKVVPWRGYEETEKAFVTEIMAGVPSVLIDNANRVDFSMTSVEALMTESPAKLRVLGRTESVELEQRTLIAIAGNGLSIRSDLAGRCISINLDARVEHAGERKFSFDPLERARAEREASLSDVLTILRWGTQNRGTMMQGRPMGGFEEWTTWVRDPLLTLGCPDLVARVREIQEQDTNRIVTAGFMAIFYASHQLNQVKFDNLAYAVRYALNPNRGSGPPFVGLTDQQFLQRLRHLDGTRAGGWVFTRNLDPFKKRPTYTYSVHRPDGDYGPYLKVVDGSNGS